MKTYIDAKSLIDELSAACMPIYEKGITGILGDNSSIADIINEQPAVDVQEVKHGCWVYKERTKVVNTDNVGILEGYRTITEENIDKATIILKKRITVKVPFARCAANTATTRATQRRIALAAVREWTAKSNIRNKKRSDFNV